jgi:hypothetical protein
MPFPMQRSLLAKGRPLERVHAPRSPHDWGAYRSEGPGRWHIIEVFSRTVQLEEAFFDDAYTET